MRISLRKLGSEEMPEALRQDIRLILEVIGFSIILVCGILVLDMHIRFILYTV